MVLGLTYQQAAFFLIMIVSFTLLVTEKLRSDLVAVLIIISLVISGVLKSGEALSGFGSEPAIIVVSIFVISGAFQQTGLADMMGAWVNKLAGQHYERAIVVIMTSVGILSAFTHHVTTTAVMLPVVLSLSRERNIPASKLLMPLSISASLGTTITIIGAPAFLVASDILVRAGRPALGIFSIAPIGIALTIFGTLFMLLAGRYILPVRKQGEDLANIYRLDKYFTEIKILPESPFIGKSLKEFKEERKYHFTVAGWVRNGDRLRGYFSRYKLQENDILLIHSTPEDIITFREEKGIELHPVEKFGSEEEQETDTTAENAAEELVQAVIAPSSELLNRTLKDVDFRANYGAIVVGLWRREGFIKQELSSIKLKAGDVLLLRGDDESLTRISNDPAFLMLIPFHSEIKVRRKAGIAAFIMVCSIIMAGFNILPLEIIMLAGASAMILTRSITMRQAYKCIDAKVYVFIAGAIPLGAAIQKTGTDKLIAQWLHSSVAGWHPVLILLLVFTIVAIITQFMSDAATTAFFAPVGIAFANTLNMAPEPFVITIAMSAVASFLTPIGHHGNLLIYGPGGYRFRDFITVGIPLTIGIAVIVVFLSRMLWH